MDTKACCKCGEVKSLDDFYVDRNKPGNRRAAYCKLCRNRKRGGLCYSTTWKHKHPDRAVFNQVKQNARKRGDPFFLTVEDIKVPETCPVLGIPIFLTPGKRTDNTPSVDRVDNSKGYTKENVVIISWRANQIKRDASLQELKKLVEYLERHLRKEEILGQ